jgi:probable biosynthetic protein (TIGR04099 family)
MMTSVFVRRTETGSNRSITRVEVPGLPPVAPLQEFVEHQAVFGELRRGSWATHLGFIRSEADTLDRLVVDPCPAQDFNGAEFLYFSSFQAFVDRAEWKFFRPANPRRTTRRRDIVYHGNVDPGEHIAVVLCAVRRQNDGYAHWCRLVRKIDDAPLADVFTLRQD